MPLFENVPCPNCSRSLRLPADVIGSSVQCPICKTAFTAARDGDRIETIPEAIALDEDPVPTAGPVPPPMSLDDDIPDAPLAPDDEALDPIPVADEAPRPVRRRGTFAPVAFIVFIQRDPRDKLEGRFHAEVDAKGVHLWRDRGRVITVAPGSKVTHKGGARLSLEVEGRVVDLTVIHGGGNAAELAEQLTAFLKGERDDVRLPHPSGVALLPLALLPLGMPLLAGLLGHNIGGLVGTAVWAAFAAALLGGGCALIFGLRGSLGTRGLLAGLVVAFGYLALSVGFLIDFASRRTGTPRPPTGNWVWQTLRRPEQGFEASLPGFVVAQQRVTAPFRNEDSWLVELNTVAPAVRFQVWFGELKPALAAAPPEARRDAFTGMTGLPRFNDQLVPGHADAWEARLAGATPGRIRVYQTNKRAVVLVATSATLRPDDPSLNQFFNSLRFTGADWPGVGAGPDPQNLGPGGRVLSGPNESFVWAGVLSDGRAVGLAQRRVSLFGDGLARTDIELPLKGPTFCWGALSANRTRAAYVADNGPLLQGDPVHAPAPLPTAGLELGESRAVAVMADGSGLATGHAGGAVRLWDPDRNALVKTLKVAEAITSLAYSPDGKLLAVADAGRTITVFPAGEAAGRLMETRHGTPVAVGETASPWFHVRSLEFAPDGRRLVSAGNDKTARVWDVEAGKELHRYDHPDAVTAAAFLPGTRLLATGCADGVIRLFQLDLGERASFRQGRPGVIRSLSFTRDGAALVAVTPLGVERWDMASVVRLSAADRRPLDSLPPPATPGKLPGKLARLVGGGKALVALMDDRSARRMSLPSRLDAGEVAKASLPGAAAVACSADGTTMAHSAGPVVTLHDPATGRETGRVLGRTEPAAALSLSADGKKLALLDGRTLGVWDAATKGETRVVHGVKDASAVALSPDGKTAAVVSRASDYVHLFDVAAGREALRLVGHKKGLTAVGYSADGKQLATLSLDGTARLWDTAAGRIRFRLDGHSAPADGAGFLAFSPDGRTLAASSGAEAVFTDTGSGRRLGSIRPACGVVFAPDSQAAYVGHSDGEVIERDLTHFRNRGAPVVVDLSGSPPPEFPDLAPASVEPHLAIVADPASGTALAFTRDRLVLRLTFPGLQVRDAFWTGKVIYRAALDAKRGLLYAAVATPESLRPRSDHSQGSGPLTVYDVRELLAGRGAPRLTPKGEVAVDGRFSDLLVGDGRIVYRRTKGGKPTLGWVDPETLKVGGDLELPFLPTGPAALSPDGKTLLASGLSDGDGQIVRIDLATLKAGEPVKTGIVQSLACGKSWVAAEVSDASPEGLRFFSPAGKELARWRVTPQSQAFAVGDRLYLATAVNLLAPAAYEVGPTPAAAAPEAPAAKVDWMTVGGVPRLSSVALLGGKVLVSSSGSAFRLLAAGGLPPDGGPALPADGSPWSLGPARVTALALTEREAAAGRSTGRIDFWPRGGAGVTRSVEVEPPVLALARGGEWFAVTTPGDVYVDRTLARKPSARLANARPLGADAVAFGPDGTAFGAADGGLALWAVGGGVKAEKAVAVGSPVTGVAVASEAGDVACGALDGVVRVFAAKTYEKRHELKGHDGEVRAVLLSKDGKRAYSAGVDGKVIVWDAEAGKALHTLEAHRHVVSALALSPDDKTLASGALDGTVSLWDAETGRLLPPRAVRVTAAAEPVAALAFGGAELWAAAGSRVRHWDLGAGKGPPPVAAAPGTVKRMTAAFREAVVDREGGYGFLIPTTGTSITRFRVPEFLPAGVYKADRTMYRLLLDRAGKRLYGFRSATPVMPNEHPPRGTDVEVLAFDVAKLPPTAKPKAKAAEAPPEARAKLKGKPFSPALSPDGKAIYFLDGEGNRLVKLDAATLTEKASEKLADPPTGLSLSPDGSRLYVATRPAAGKGRVREHDAQTLRGGAALSFSAAEVFDLAAADGGRVAVSAKGVVRLYDMKATKLREWATGADRTFVRVSADGKTAVVVPAGVAPFRAQAWPLDGGAARTTEVPAGVTGGEFTLSDDGSFVVLRGGAVILAK